ncbi:MAG: hypothetical protein JSV80_15505, partial [Acidobacteriota bacterium]
TAARAAYEQAWPVLRLVLAAEQSRLAQVGAGTGPAPELQLRVYAYRAHPERTAFTLGERPFETSIGSFEPAGTRPPLDWAGFERFLERGLSLEGGRLDAAGQLRLLASEPTGRPRWLGRSLELSDLAVAYRAVFHGGAGEPYMSLDRGDMPQTASVNYGGRLRDTTLGLVSLLCDVRFKTFSLGIDVLEGADARARLRRRLVSFRTHVERFAKDPRSGSVLEQQTRLWFYPDAVELTLSEAGDVMVLRRARMTAASERAQRSAGEARLPAPWTQATVAAINEHYDELAEELPELADLDQVVRMLSLFAWLRQAADEGLAIPELDVLLAAELPTMSTPRTFPQLLGFNALPPAGREGPVEVLDRASVVASLDRLGGVSHGRLSAEQRFQRALAALDPRLPQHAQLARQLSSVNTASVPPTELDALAYRAERLVMHRLVLGTLPDEDRARLAERQRGFPERLRVFSVGIGGLDLRMGQVLARAERRTRKMGWGASRPIAGPRPAPPGTVMRHAPAEPKPDWRRDPDGLPSNIVPAHGLDAGGAPAPLVVDTAQNVRRWREFGGGWAQRVTSKGSEGRAWLQSVLGADGPEASSRLVEVGPEGRALLFERYEQSRALRYRFERTEQRLIARPAGPLGLADELKQRPVPAARDRSTPSEPERPATLEIAASGDPATLRVTLTAADQRELTADVPRSLLQRAVLGPRADVSRGLPLAGLAPFPDAAGSPPAVIVWSRADQQRVPWSSGPAEAVGAASIPGEENPLRLAEALNEWWREPRSRGPHAMIGTDRARTVARWQRAPRAENNALLLLPEPGFTGLLSGFDEQLESLWKAGPVARELPSSALSQTIWLVSAEPPGMLAERLRKMARSPALEGRLLAVWSLAGPIREDLPAGLLAEGRLAGVGVSAWPPTGRRGIATALADLASAVAAIRDRDVRVETLPGPTLWFF